MAGSEGGTDMKSYDVEINGIATTLKLSDDEAERRGLKAAPAAKTKARTPANKAAAPASDRRQSVADKAFGGKSKQTKDDA